jgi:hypothetical protein
LAFTDLSQTSPNFNFIIQRIFHINSAISKNHSILLGILGIVGAGGKIGNSKSTLGINDGNSGKDGGSGNTGISGKLILISTQNAGGSGKLGKSGKLILIGWKLKSGNTISKPKSISVKSKVMFGILKFGICIIGRLNKHSMDNIHEY